MSSKRFEGRTVIVTGGGSGIGKATVERIVAEGGRVVAVDISQERLDALAAELDGAVVTVTGDLTDSAVVTAAVEAAGDTIDGLANVAGIMDGFEPTAEIQDETWDRVMAVNVTAMMKLTRAVLGPMLAAGKGSIVNVSSDAGHSASTSGTPYTTSKHAVNGFTKSTAFYYTPKGVRCNAVSPGGVGGTHVNETSAFRSEWAAQRVGPLLQTNLPPMASPEELAAAITWLLSDDASNVSGAILQADGGWAAV